MKPIATISGILQGLDNGYVAVAIDDNQWEIWRSSVYEEMIRKKEEVELKLP